MCTNTKIICSDSLKKPKELVMKEKAALICVSQNEDSIPLFFSFNGKNSTAQFKILFSFQKITKKHTTKQTNQKLESYVFTNQRQEAEEKSRHW